MSYHVEKTILKSPWLFIERFFVFVWLQVFFAHCNFFFHKFICTNFCLFPSFILSSSSPTTCITQAYTRLNKECKHSSLIYLFLSKILFIDNVSLTSSIFVLDTANAFETSLSFRTSWSGTRWFGQLFARDRIGTPSHSGGSMALNWFESTVLIIALRNEFCCWVK